MNSIIKDIRDMFINIINNWNDGKCPFIKMKGSYKNTCGFTTRGHNEIDGINLNKIVKKWFKRFKNYFELFLLHHKFKAIENFFEFKSIH